MPVSLEQRLDRKLKTRAKSRPVTIDDATEILGELGSKAKRSIRTVLRRPDWTPVSWHRTKKASRHGRPIRGWKPATV